MFVFKIEITRNSISKSNVLNKNDQTNASTFECEFSSEQFCVRLINCSTLFYLFQIFVNAIILNQRSNQHFIFKRKLWTLSNQLLILFLLLSFRQSKVLNLWSSQFHISHNEKSRQQTIKLKQNYLNKLHYIVKLNWKITIKFQ